MTGHCFCSWKQRLSMVHSCRYSLEWRARGEPRDVKLSCVDIPLIGTIYGVAIFFSLLDRMFASSSSIRSTYMFLSFGLEQHQALSPRWHSVRATGAAVLVAPFYRSKEKTSESLIFLPTKMSPIFRCSSHQKM